MTSRAPDTPKSVSACLRTLGFSPLKRFGQNFLIDPQTLDRIAALGELGDAAAVLEVGPGLGALTERLLRTGIPVIASEIDRGLVRHLNSTFADEPHLTVIEGDALAPGNVLAPMVAEALIERTHGKAWHVVANLPYNITSPLLVALMAPPGPPRRSVVMVQREVGDVLKAHAGDESWSTLSIAVQSRFAVTKAIDVPSSRFFPRPDVDSSVMVLAAHDKPAVHPTFLPFVRKLFQARRKSLRGILTKGLGDARLAVAALEQAGIPLEERPDRIPVEALILLHRAAGHPSGW